MIQIKAFKKTLIYQGITTYRQKKLLSTKREEGFPHPEALFFMKKEFSTSRSVAQNIPMCCS